jgi:hypothetical protein
MLKGEVVGRILQKAKNLEIHEPIVGGHYPLAGSILLSGLSPLYHDYRGSTLNQPEVLLSKRLVATG